MDKTSLNQSRQPMRVGHHQLSAMLLAATITKEKQKLCWMPRIQ